MDVLQLLQQQYTETMEENPAAQQEGDGWDDHYAAASLITKSSSAPSPVLQQQLHYSSSSSQSSHPIIPPSFGTVPLSFNPSCHHHHHQQQQQPLGPPLVALPAHPNPSSTSSFAHQYCSAFSPDPSLSSFTFDHQRFHTFQREEVDSSAASAGNESSTYRLKREKRKAQRRLLEKDARDSQEETLQDDPSSASWLRKNTKSPWFVEDEDRRERELTEEQGKSADEEHAAENSKKRKTGSPAVAVVEEVDFENRSSSFFQGQEEEGTWFLPPKYIKKTKASNYLPKRCMHTWRGHTQAVNAIRFFPNYGHLLLSSSMDTTVKIWDVHGHGRCMRTYGGHSVAVKDICFANDGSQFLSASFDRSIKLWDTETGYAISTFSTGKMMPYVVKLHPDDDKQHILLAGMSRGNKVVEWDTRTGKVTQSYEEHRGAVNTITFVDENRRFVTSSDDLSLMVWEMGIPVVIQHIREPNMHAISSIAVHPEKKWMAAQSMDDQILVYSTGGTVRQNGRKKFSGHTTGGHPCQLNFSPDGRFLMSGDAHGRCWFWAWQTGNIHRTLQPCHHGACLACEWHPLLPSHVATSCADGLIKYWS